MKAQEQPSGATASGPAPNQLDARRNRSFFGASYPMPSSELAAKIMKANRNKNTAPELQLRSVLHGMGLRFRVNMRLRVDEGRPVVADVAFTRAKVTVFVDGCFWHGCDIHRSTPRANATYWGPKLARNRERDQETIARLERAGWRAIRVWEHEDVHVAAAAIASLIEGSATTSRPVS